MNNQQDYETFSQKGKYSDIRLNENGTVHQDLGDGQTIDLMWLLAVLRRRAWVMAMTVFILCGFSGSMILWNSKKIVPTYEGSFRLLIEPVTAEGRLARLLLLAESGGNTDLTDITAKLGIDKTDLVDYETMMRVLTSPKLMYPLVDKLQTQYPKISYEILRSKLILTRLSYKKDGKEQGTKILLVRYQDSDTKKIKFVLDKVAETYLQYSLEERLNTLRKGIQFIDEQLPHLEARVDSFQKQLQRLRQEHQINDPKKATMDLSEEALLIREERIRNEVELEAQRDFYGRIKQEIDSGRLPIGILSQKPQIYGNILSKLHGIEAEIAMKSVQLREDALPMQILREKQRNILDTLLQIAEKELQAVAQEIQESEARNKYIDQVENQLNEKIKNFPVVLRQYAEIERNLAVATESLKSFLEKRETVVLNASQKEVPWQVISPTKLTRNANGNPIPTSQKNTKKNLAIAIILSVLLGVGIGLLIEVLNTVFHSPEELKGSTKLRLLGIIPWAKKIQEVEKRYQKIARRRPKDVESYNLPQPEYSASFLEAFRSLYTNISLLGSKNRPIRSLVVSSAAPEDGKSIIAVQLAQTAATIGQRVLLVDADLRNPQLHLRLGLQNQRGLSDTVANYLSLNEIIQRSPIEEKLFFLSAGQVSPDPIKLISSQKMEYLMGQLQGFFDLVIYNTPPLVGLADGPLIADRTDGTILVVRLEKTDRSLVKKALEELKISGVAVLGVVANGVKG